MAIIKKGTVVSHFKRFHLQPSDLKEEPNKYLYEIVDIAINCSDEEKTMVAYRALYGERLLFVRSIEDFTAYVRTEGRYRFAPWKEEQEGD